MRKNYSIMGRSFSCGLTYGQIWTLSCENHVLFISDDNWPQAAEISEPLL